jgi:hypothetical protein
VGRRGGALLEGWCGDDLLAVDMQKEEKSLSLVDKTGPHSFEAKPAPPLTPCGLGSPWERRMRKTPAPDETLVWRVRLGHDFLRAPPYNVLEGGRGGWRCS